MGVNRGEVARGGKFTRTVRIRGGWYAVIGAGQGRVAKHPDMLVVALRCSLLDSLMLFGGTEKRYELVMQVSLCRRLLMCHPTRCFPDATRSDNLSKTNHVL